MVWHQGFIRRLQMAVTGASARYTETDRAPASSPVLPLAYALEPRMLFDGAAAATVQQAAETTSQPADAATADSHSAASQTSSAQNHDQTSSNTTTSDSSTHQSEQGSDAQTTALAAAPADSGRKEVVFIDTSLQDYQTLVAGVPSGTEVVLIDGTKDGLQQIADWAASHSGYDAIHIFSHGSEADIHLGSSQLTVSSLSNSTVQSELATIGSSLNADGDILIYGCDVAAGNDGSALIDGIAAATGADVAASTNATGNSLTGGDWVLEANSGSIESHALHVDAYQGLLTEVSFDVNDPELQYTQNSYNLTVDSVAFNVSTETNGLLGVDSTYNEPGLWGFAGDSGNRTSLTISAAAGYTFDLSTLDINAVNGNVVFTLTYSDGSSGTVTLSNVNTADLTTQSGLAINDVTKVVMSSDDFASVQNLQITDVKAIVVTPNEAPGLTTTTSTPTFTEDGSAVALFSGTTISTGESGQTIKSFTLTVSNLSDGSSELLGIDGSTVALTNGNSVATADGNVSVSLAGGTATVTFSSSAGLSAATAQSIINGLTYRNSSQNPAVDNRVVTLTRIQDSGGTANGGVDTTALAASSTVVVHSVNDFPGVTRPDPISVTEDVSTAITGIVFSDVDSNGQIETAGLWVASGSWTAVSSGGVTVSGSGSNQLTLLGTVADLNSFIAAGKVSYLSASNQTGTVSASVSLTDHGDTRSDSSVKAVGSPFNLSIAAVNDAPVNSLPASATVVENGTLTFSSANGNAISVSDVDVGSGNLQITLTATNGLLTLGSVSGLTFSTGTGSSNATMTFQGTQTSINQALQGLTFTPTSGYTGSASVQLVTNDLGNTGSGGAKSDTDSIAIDVTQPVASVTGVSASVANGSYGTGSTIIVAVSFDQNVSVTGTPQLQLETGSTDRMAYYLSGSGTSTLLFSYTVQAGDTSADLDYVSSSALQLNGGTIRDSSSNNAQLTLAAPGSASSLGANKNIVIDTVQPTASVTTADSVLTVGESTTVNITFSEPVTGFTLADLSASNGTLTNLQTSDNINWTALFTPTANTTSYSNMIALNNSGVTDQAGNAGNGLTYSNNYLVDTQRPTAQITLDNTNLKAGQTAQVTIVFSEAVTGFSVSDLAVDNGTLGPLSSSDGGMTWVATFTPTANIADATNLITLDNSGFSDLTGNSGTGTTDSGNYSINTRIPTAAITINRSSLNIDQSADVTITFSEAVTGLTTADVTVSNGTLSTFSSNDGGITWTSTLSPDANITASSNVLTLDNSGIANQAGNAGSGYSISNNYSIDTRRPTATITLSDTQLNASETAQVTITFSEAVSGLTPADLVVPNATLSNLTTTNNIVWTATLTPTGDQPASGYYITLLNSSVSDAAGNSGSGLTLSQAYYTDITAPQATSLTVISHAAGSVTYQLQFSEAVDSVSLSDFTLQSSGTLSGSLSGLTQIDATTWQVTAGGVNGTGSLQLHYSAGNTHDLFGNAATGALNGESFSNDAPQIAAIGGQNVTASNSFSFTLPPDTFSDSDGTALSYSASTSGNQPLPAWLNFNPATRTFSGTPAQGDVGSYSLRVSVTDGFGASSYADFTLKVSAAAQPVTGGNRPLGSDPQFRMTDGAPAGGPPVMQTSQMEQMITVTAPRGETLLNAGSGLLAEAAGSLTRADFSQNSSGGHSQLGRIFSDAGPVRYATGVVRSGQPESAIGGRSDLASLFAPLALPGTNPLSVFSGSSWQAVEGNKEMSRVAPVSVFGAPVFSLQLQDVDEPASRQLATLQSALQNIKPSA